MLYNICTTLFRKFRGPCKQYSSRHSGSLSLVRPGRPDQDRSYAVGGSVGVSEVSIFALSQHDFLQS